MDVIDLHCDLLGCVAYNKGVYSFHSPEINCSLPQLEAGGVALQILAIAAITKEGCAAFGREQMDLFPALPKKGLDYLLAIENASALLDEEESLAYFFERFGECQKLKQILYVSLTWNHENRFGGGNETDIGLKEDGKAVLEFLSGKNVAIDLSHTSDRLAHDLLNWIDKKGLAVPVLASHSNFRPICDVKRNLPDVLAQEVIHRDGLIGLNFVQRFVGKDPSAFHAHIEHALALGAENTLCLGADFYGAFGISGNSDPFFPEFGDSSCYPKWIDLVKEAFTEELVAKIANANASRYLRKNGFIWGQTPSIASESSGRSTKLH